MRKTLLVLIVLLSLAPGRAQDQQPSQDDVKKRLREANARVLHLIKQELSTPEARGHDVAVRAAELQYDRQKLHEFVWKQIAFEPYPGIQRGPAGVLVSGAGNAADKAYLLMELLRANGYQARLVGATIPREKAEELIKTCKPSPHWSPSPFGVTTAPEKLLQSIAEQTGVSADEMIRLARDESRFRSAAWEEVMDIWAREDAFLHSQLESAKIDAAAPDLRESAIQATRAHVWVQWRAADGDPWEDLDPTFGTSVGHGTQVEIASLSQQFVLSLYLERKLGEKRETIDLIQCKLPVHEALLRPVQFHILPVDAAKLLPPFDKKTSAEEIYHMFRQINQFQAVLSVGGEIFGSKVFDYDGNVSTVKNNGQLQAFGELGSGLKKKIGIFDELGKEKKAEPKPELIKVWLDMKVLRGGATLWAQQRTILEEGKREEWCPILSWKLFFQTHELSARFLRTVTQTYRVRNHALFQAISNVRKPADWSNLMTLPGWEYPLDLASFCMARQAFLSRYPKRRLVFNRPNLFISGRSVMVHPDQKKLCLCYGIDIVENGAVVVDDTGALDRTATRALGVFDTVLEEVLVRRANKHEPVAGTINYFERARLTSKSMSFVAAHDVEALKRAGVPEADAKWIKAHAVEGELVLVSSLEPKHCHGTYAWWSIRPSTGQVLGRISGGRGGCLLSEYTEYVILAEYLSRINRALCALSITLYLGEGNYEEAISEFVSCFYLDLLGIDDEGNIIGEVIDLYSNLFSLMERVTRD